MNNVRMPFFKKITSEIQELPTQCKMLQCPWSERITDRETIVDERGEEGRMVYFHTCKHSAYALEGEEPTEKDCPIVQGFLKGEGFLDKCLNCEEIEVDIDVKKRTIDVWCNQDRLFECTLAEVQDVSTD